MELAKDALILAQQREIERLSVPYAKYLPRIEITADSLSIHGYQQIANHSTSILTLTREQWSLTHTFSHLPPSTLRWTMENGNGLRRWKDERGTLFYQSRHSDHHSRCELVLHDPSEYPYCTMNGCFEGLNQHYWVFEAQPWNPLFRERMRQVREAIEAFLQSNVVN